MMKKILAMVLAFSLALSALPVFAESGAEEPAGGLLSLLTEKTGGGLGEVLSGLMEKLQGSKTEIASMLALLKAKLKNSDSKIGKLVSGLLDMLQGDSADLGSLLGGILGGGSNKGLGSLLGGDGSGMDLGSLLGGDGSGMDLGSLLGGDGSGMDLGSLLGGDGSGMDLSSLLGGDGSGMDLGSLLGSLLGGEDAGELSAEDADILTKLKEAEEIPDIVIDQKDVTNVDEFFGKWMTNRFYIGEEATDLSDTGEYITIDETGLTIYSEGEVFREVKGEMKIEDNKLLIQEGEDWLEYTLTVDDELVTMSGFFLVYYTRATE